MNRACAVGVALLLSASTAACADGFVRRDGGVCKQSKPAKASTFNPYTFYFVMGKQPRGIPDFGAFFLNEVKSTGGKMRAEGGIFTDLSDPDKGMGLKTVTVDAKRLAFASESKGGVSFRFEGRFLQSGDLRRFKDAPKRVATLEGKLRRFVNGKQKAAAMVRFYCQSDVN